MRLVIVAIITFVLGFAAGMYSLPIIQASKLAPPVVEGFTGQEAGRTGVFRDDLPGNDFLHWGRGQVMVTDDVVAFNQVELAPGPDYRLYLVPEAVGDEAGFQAVKARSVNIAPIHTFNGSAQYKVPAGVNTADYKAVLVWCESFGEFITMAELSAQ